MRKIGDRGRRLDCDASEPTISRPRLEVQDEALTAAGPQPFRRTHRLAAQQQPQASPRLLSVQLVCTLPAAQGRTTLLVSMSLPSRALRRVQLGQLARVRHVLAAALPVGLPSQGPCVLQRAPSAACRLRTYATSPFAPSSSPAPQFPDPASSDREREHDKKGSEAKGERRSGPGGMFPSFTNSPALDAALTTVVGLFLVFGSGTAYLAWYKVRLTALAGPRAARSSNSLLGDICLTTH